MISMRPIGVWSLTGVVHRKLGMKEQKLEMKEAVGSIRTSEDLHSGDKVGLVLTGCRQRRRPFVLTAILSGRRGMDGWEWKSDGVIDGFFPGTFTGKSGYLFKVV